MLCELVLELDIKNDLIIDNDKTLLYARDFPKKGLEALKNKKIWNLTIESLNNDTKRMEHILFSRNWTLILGIRHLQGDNDWNLFYGHFKPCLTHLVKVLLQQHSYV
jgi:hypothetical protein